MVELMHSVLKADLRRYARLEYVNTELHHLLGFERAVNKAHEQAVLKTSKETEKLRSIVKELGELHSPGWKSDEYCGGCGQDFPAIHGSFSTERRTKNAFRRVWRGCNRREVPNAIELDGARRMGFSPYHIIGGIKAKQARNEARTWPDYREFTESDAFEHDRTVKEQQLRNVNSVVLNQRTCSWKEWRCRRMCVKIVNNSRTFYSGRRKLGMI